MKINAITPFKTNLTVKNNPIKQSNFNNQIAFNSLLDVFQRQKRDERYDKQTDNTIKYYVNKEALADEKTLKQNAKAFDNNIKQLLKLGKENEYRSCSEYLENKDGYFNIVFGKYDEELKAPEIINLWQNGRVKSYFEIFSTEPELTYTYTNIGDEVEKHYAIENGQVTSFYACDKNGEMVFHFSYGDSLKRQEAIRVNGTQAQIITELYYDMKNPENSYYKEGAQDGIMEFRFDAKKNMWYFSRLINPEEIEAQEEN